MNISQIAVASLVLLMFGISGPTAYAVTEDDKITAADAASRDFFGFSVAVSGTTVVVAAPLDDDAGDSSGSSYVFDCSSFPCVQVSKLTASDAAAGDQFGRWVSVNGTTAVISAAGNDDAGNNSGSAYYFDLSTCGAACTETGKLTASDAAPGDGFGSSVAVSGTTAVVGAIFGDDVVVDSGAAYYFDLSTCGAACTETGKLTASDAVFRDFFGSGVAISGTTAVVGAPSILDSISSGSGSAYYFDLSTCGMACTETGKLTASDAVAGDRFGHTAVAVSATTAVVGAFLNDAAGNDSGSAYYFDLSTCGAACTETGKLIASDATGNQFARGVDVNGTTAVVGAAGNENAGIVSGSAYIFDLSTCGAACTETDKLTASDGAEADLFGFSVAVGETTAVVGANHDDDGGDNSGSAYVFELDVVIPDTDEDGVPDVDDNCPIDSNPNQTDTDLDGDGDACDADDDNDGVLDEADNCQFTANSDQADLDDDGLGDVCDDDRDGDGIPDGADNCPLFPNPFQTDTDGDGLGDACDDDDDNDGVCDTGQSGAGCVAGPDNCPTLANQDQSDLDGDGIGDVCDTDVDGDGIDNDVDNCPVDANPSQDDTDFDGAGDACDPDDDNDGVNDEVDNCPLMFNPNQDDSDGDGRGDVCDQDLDGDGVDNTIDNCPLVPNASQNDFDANGAGDACDPDIDGDGVDNGTDICEFTQLGETVDPATGCAIDQLAPCESPRGQNVPWKNHGQYMKSVVHTVKEFIDLGLITEEEGEAIKSGAGESDCGK